MSTPPLNFEAVVRCGPPHPKAILSLICSPCEQSCFYVSKESKSESLPHPKALGLQIFSWSVPLGPVVRGAPDVLERFLVTPPRWVDSFWSQRHIHRELHSSPWICPCDPCITKQIQSGRQTIVPTSRVKILSPQFQTARNPGVGHRGITVPRLPLYHRCGEEFWAQYIVSIAKSR